MPKPIRGEHQPAQPVDMDQRVQGQAPIHARRVIAHAVGDEAMGEFMGRHASGERQQERGDRLQQRQRAGIGVQDGGEQAYASPRGNR